MGGLGVSLGHRSGLASKAMNFLKARSIRLPVMSLAYSAGVLKSHHEIQIIDAANMDMDAVGVLESLLDFKPEIILSATSIAALIEEVQFLSSAKEILKCKLILLGDAASLRAESVLANYDIDYIIQGDEPEAVLMLAPSLEAEILRKTPGVIGKTGSEVWNTGVPPTLMELDAIPFPSWDGFPVQYYRYFPTLRRGPFLTVLSSRGCPYGCIYCPYTSNQGLKYRYRSAENVVLELFQLKRAHQIGAFLFRDPTFTLRKPRVHEICDGILKHRLGLDWGCETRVDCLDDPLIEHMVKAGLKGVSIGVESTDPAVIRNAKRGWIDPSLIETRVRRLTSLGVRVQGFFIVGLPGESLETIKRTIDFASQLPLSYAEFKVATPFPGTPLFEMAQQNGWIDKVELNRYTSYDATLRLPNLPPDRVKSMTERAYRKFYLSPKRILKEVTQFSFWRCLFQIMVRNRIPGSATQKMPILSFEPKSMS